MHLFMINMAIFMDSLTNLATTLKVSFILMTDTIPMKID